MGESWGPWIEHDGKGCPVPVGTWVHVVGRGNWEIEARAGCTVIDRSHKPVQRPASGRSRWVWADVPETLQIIRYRIRKPRGLTILENLIADLPAPVGPKVDA